MPFFFGDIFPPGVYSHPWDPKTEKQELPGSGSQKDLSSFGSLGLLRITPQGRKNLGLFSQKCCILFVYVVYFYVG